MWFLYHFYCDFEEKNVNHCMKRFKKIHYKSSITHVYLFCCFKIVFCMIRECRQWANIEWEIWVFTKYAYTHARITQILISDMNENFIVNEQIICLTLKNCGLMSCPFSYYSSHVDCYHLDYNCWFMSWVSNGRSRSKLT